MSPKTTPSAPTISVTRAAGEGRRRPDPGARNRSRDARLTYLRPLPVLPYAIDRSGRRATARAGWASRRPTARRDDVAVPVPLMLATLTDRREFGDDWLLERKFDGERCVARTEGDEVRLESRTGKDLTGTYPEVRAALAGPRDRELLLDGEVVAFDGDQTSFSRLQQRLGTTRPSPEQLAAFPVVYCVFDVLEVDGEDLTGRPLGERRERL